ncbi:HTH domain-containing protein [Haloarcula brevis]|uniref:HTH domain-containing protein n=1 Tax=Haloarcula brevis TaxID=3111453 RepID=UPI00300EBFC9
MDSTPTPVRVELFVRSLCPEGATRHQNYVLDRLQALEEAGAIEDLSVLIWGNRIEPDIARRTPEGRRLLARLSRFRKWARDADASLDAFDWGHPVTNVASDESLSVITLPTLALAEYVDDDLQHVAPCTRDGVAHRVTDRVDRLADATRPTDEPEREHTVVQ